MAEATEGAKAGFQSATTGMKASAVKAGNDAKELAGNMTKGSWWKDSFIGLCGPSVWRCFKFSYGDISGFFQLTFDNVATVLTLVNLLSFSNGFGILNDDDIYGSVLPGLGISMVYGNIWYSWLGCRLSARTGRDDVTCQPYGINTPGSFSILYGVLLTASMDPNLPFCTDETQNTDECKQRSKDILAIGVAANLMQGVIAAALGLVGPWVSRIAPAPALYSAIAGIGFAFLLIGQIVGNFQEPLAGLPPLFMMMIVYFGNINTGWIPEATIIALVGTALAWMDGVVDGDTVDAAVKHVKWQGVTATFSEAFDWSGLSSYVGLIVPVAIASAVSTLMCWRAATDNGDEFPLRETMIVDGCGSMVAAVFGCPFGTSVYVGHTAYKKVGARNGYSILNCVFLLILGLFGLFALIQAIIPTFAVAPLIAFVGLLIVADSVAQLPLRHVAPLIFGIAPAVCDWANNACSRTTEDGDSCFVNTNPVGAGISALQNGYMMNSMMLTALFAVIVDRKFFVAAIWSTACAILSLFGIMHQTEINADFDEGGNLSKWRFCTGYMIVTGILLVVWLWQTFLLNGEGCIGKVFGGVEPPITDPKAYVSIGELVALAREVEGEPVPEAHVGGSVAMAHAGSVPLEDHLSQAGMSHRTRTTGERITGSAAKTSTADKATRQS